MAGAANAHYEGTSTLDDMADAYLDVIETVRGRRADENDARGALVRT